MTRESSVSLVLCTYRRLGLLRNVLAQVSGLRTCPEEVVVVGQAIEEADALSLIEDVFPKLEGRGIASKFVIFNPPNLPLARDIGIRESSGDIVMFVDDDVILDSEIVAQHRSAHKDGHVGGVGGRSTGDDPWPFTPLADGAKTDRIIGCNMSFKRAALVDVGGFDPGFAPASTGEETDLCDRLVRSGWNLRYSERSVLLHLKSASGGERGRQADQGYFQSYIRNAAILWFRRYGALGVIGLARHRAWFRRSTAGATFRGLRQAWNERHEANFLTGSMTSGLSEFRVVYPGSP